MQMEKMPTPRLMRETFTVKELLLEIREVILVEPRRLDMNDWVAALDGQMRNGDSLDMHDLGRPGDFKPACGTVGCLAGWGAVLCRPDGIPMYTLHLNASDVMRYVLGFTSVSETGEVSREVGGLFSPYRKLEFEEFIEYADEEFDPETLPEPGTEEHASLVARRIDRYMVQHPEVMGRTVHLVDVQRWLLNSTTLPEVYD